MPENRNPHENENPTVPPMTWKITRNAIRCNLCGDIIESVHAHDFVTCKCGCCSVDGGLEYIRREFTHSKDDFTELSTFEDPEAPPLSP